MRNKRREARGAEARAPDTEPFPELQTAAAASLCGTQVPTVAPARMCITEPHHEAEDPPWRHRARTEPDADTARAQGSSGTGRRRLCPGRREREGDIGAGPRRGKGPVSPRAVRAGGTSGAARRRQVCARVSRMSGEHRRGQKTLSEERWLRLLRHQTAAPGSSGGTKQNRRRKEHTAARLVQTIGTLR